MFTAGLLHDIGKVLIAQRFPEEIDDIMPRTHSRASYLWQRRKQKCSDLTVPTRELQASMGWQFTHIARQRHKDAITGHSKKSYRA